MLKKQTVKKIYAAAMGAQLTTPDETRYAIKGEIRKAFEFFREAKRNLSSMTLLGPIGLAFTIVALLGVLQLIDSYRAVGGIKSYRQRYVQLVDRLEELTRSCTDVASRLEGLKQSEDWDKFEMVLRTLELLIRAVTELPPHAGNARMLEPAFSLAREAEAALRQVAEACKGQSSLRLPWKLLGGTDGTISLPAGCYFCSRPFDVMSFKKVRVKLEGQKRDAYGCATCRNRLDQKKKVRVLFFDRDGKHVHWSELQDYKPAPDYFDINRVDSIPAKQGLHLVMSESDSEHP